MLGLKRFWVQITADRKRFGLLCAMLALGLLLWMRMILISDHPRTAMANEERTAAESNRPRSDNRTPSMSVVLASAPGRDPFVISDTHFPPPKTPEGFVEDADKSGQQAVEDPELAEARYRAWLEEEVSKFRLEANMQSLVLINGRHYRLHDELPAVDDADVVFRIVEIHDRSVVVEHEGRLFELMMKSPGTGSNHH